MVRFSFRLKLTAAMLGLLGALTAGSLWVTQRHVAETYQSLFAERFAEQSAATLRLQDSRLADVKRRSADFAAMVRLGALMRRLREDADDPAAWRESGGKLYATARDDLGPSMSSRTVLRFADADGRLVPDAAADPAWDPLLENLAPALLAGPAQKAGTLVTGLHEMPLAEFVFARITDPVSGKALGGLMLAFPAPALPPLADAVEAWWLDGRLHAPHMEKDARTLLEAGLQRLENGFPEGGFTVPGPQGGWQVHAADLNQGSALPPAIHLLAYPRASLLAAKARLAGRVAFFGLLGLLAASFIAAWVSHGLTVPLREIARGTAAIQAGRYDTRVAVRTRDEVGDVGIAFNEMAAGLALKEKYRSVLDKVSDPGVAAALMQGELALGGERRRACVLFCDIRGFTPLTQDMDPREVIQLLNEHFTPLAKIIARHHGVVDKYVGDLVMAVFGAPVSRDSDVEDAVACALEMTRARLDLNENNPRPIRIGIGLAAGDMVAGCMGSADRLNYTVLGERVNLAARLCSRAAPMEILADAETLAMAGPRIRAESIGSIELKGFSQAIDTHRILDILPP